jgi:hypothetical protein
MIAYETLIRAALADGVIQENERMMLESVRTSNQISEADAKMAERKLREELGIGPVSQEEETYYSLLKTAFADGVLSESEAAMLQSMKTTLEVSDDREAVLKENVVRELGVGVPINASEETYYSLLKTAFADGVLSESEGAMLQSMKASLGVSDEREAAFKKGMGADVAPPAPEEKEEEKEKGTEEKPESEGESGDSQ